MTAAAARRADVRSRIIDVAAQLLRDEGPTAVTTRGVAEQAGVQAPMIYRLFGDKDGLLEAVAEHVMAAYVAAKTEIAEAASAAGIDPLTDLRAAWQTQIDFGVGNPSLFQLLSDPDRVRQSPAARAGREVLQARIHRVAAGLAPGQRAARHQPPPGSRDRHHPDTAGDTARKSRFRPRREHVRRRSRADHHRPAGTRAPGRRHDRDGGHSPGHRTTTRRADPSRAADAGRVARPRDRP